MKILYHHRTRATDAQGVHIGELVGAFRSLGHSVEMASLVAAGENQAAAPQDAGEPLGKRITRRLPFAFEAIQLGYNVVALPWLILKILRFHPDFLYERYSLFNFAGVLAAFLTRRPIILEVNSPLALEQHREKEIRAGRFSAWMERIICNAATKVIVVSGPLRRILIDSGIRESKLERMPNGVNLEHLSEPGDTAGLRESLGLRGRTVIGFVGWFRAWHGLDSLIEAFATSDLAHQGASLLLIGDGPETPALRALAKQHGVEKYVVFTGAVPHPEIPPYLALIDIAVQPAANEYCCPMKILEYMGLSKAIVAPRQENIEELLEDGRQAMLFSPGDRKSLAQGLTALVRDPEQRRLLGNNGRAAIDQRGLLWTTNAEAVVRLAAGRPTTGFPAPVQPEKY